MPPASLRLDLHQAATQGRRGVVRLQLDAGVSVDTRDNQGFTALHRAVQYGHEAGM